MNTHDDPLLPVLDQLRSSAVQRDQRGGHAAEEKALLRQAGLLARAVPTELGGAGASWTANLATVRRIAAVDSALAHVLAFQYLQVATVLLNGTTSQQDRWLRPTAADGLWWGNAINSRDTRLTARSDGTGGYVLDGVKGFCSGTRGSHFMTVSAVVAGEGRPLLAVLPTQQRGITVRDDWNPIGQRQTDSGSVLFEQVRVSAADILRAPGSEPTPRQTLRTCLGQLILTNLYAGIAAGALEAARDYALRFTRPLAGTGVAHASEDPYRLQRFGDMHVQASTAAAMADRAAQALDQALAVGEALTSEQRSAAALAVAEAKVVAHRASLFTSQELFEATGASATNAGLGLDRFWRNARTHTLHDPLDYKLRALGHWALRGELPAGPYL